MNLADPRKYFIYTRKLWWLARSRIECSRNHIKLGAGISFHGVPIISTHPNSTIIIGDRVGLCSDSKHTALGVSRPVILRTLRAGATLSIGNDSGLSGTCICASISVQIGERCLIGADVIVTDTDFHPIDPCNRRYRSESEARSKPIVIENDVFIGARVIILPGVRIGIGSVIGAGSVVSRDIPPYSVAVGNPARVSHHLESD